MTARVEGTTFEQRPTWCEGAGHAQTCRTVFQAAGTASPEAVMWDQHAAREEPSTGQCVWTTGLGGDRDGQRADPEGAHQLC